MRNWVFHLGAAGVPVSWSVYGVYTGAYGSARLAAKTRYDRTGQDSLDYHGEKHPEGQFVIEVTRNGSIARCELLFDAEHHRKRQSPDDGKWLVQFHTLLYEVPEVVKEAVIEGLRTALIEADYLIPRHIWEERYPEDAEVARQISQHIQESLT